jgi:hypothetical protein
MKKTICLMLLLMVFALSCRKITNTQPAFTSASFPLAVGNWWQYQLINNSIGYTDTFMLSVVSISDTGSYAKYECNYIYNGVVTSSGYFLRSDTSISFTNIGAYAFLASYHNFYLRLPANAGSHWPGMFPDPADSIVVDGVVNDCQGPTPPSVGPCYILGEHYTSGTNSVGNLMTLVPKIGLIDQSIHLNGDTIGLVQQRITLLNYHVQ